MSGAIAAGNRHSAEAGAWALGEGGTCVDAAARGDVRRLRDRRPADRAGRRWLRPARRAGRGAARPRLLLRRPVGAARRDGRDRGRLRGCVDAGLPRRRGIRRGARAAAGSRRGPRASRPAPLARALHPGAGARTAAVRGDAGPGVPPRDPRPDPATRGRRPPHLRPRRRDRRGGSRPDARCCSATPARRPSRCCFPTSRPISTRTPSPSASRWKAPSRAPSC